MRKRVGIVTLYGLWNYGNRLQNFAVSQILEKEGFAVETLVGRRLPTARRIKELTAELLGRAPFAGMHLRKKSAFVSFDRKIKKHYVRNAAHARRLSADLEFVAIGSDQIWHPRYGILSPEYELVRDIGSYRIALSPSISSDHLSSEQKKVFASYLGSIDQLSSREYQGANIVKALTGRDVPTLVDPTLMLTEADWLEVASFDLVPSGPYIFVYLLGEEGSPARTAVRSYASARGYRVVSLLDRSCPEFYPAGPDDFLGLLSRSALIVTDSYHALIFGLQFDKDVILVPRAGDNTMNSRFLTLKEILNIEFAASDVIPGGELVKIDRGAFDERLADSRAAFNHYLRSAVTKAC